MFSNKDLRKLLIPLMIEQLLISLMGTIDTIMVSCVGTSEVSAVSLVDSINKLIIYIFMAVATGGAIICSQYIGKKDRKNCNRAAGQVLLAALILSGVVTLCFLVFRRQLLRLIFGTVEASVMEASESYFLITIFSYPFMALFSASSALYRSAGNSRLPMVVSGITNGINILGNALLLFVFRMGVAGAALSTTFSVALSCVIMLYFQRKSGQVIEVGKLTKLRPDPKEMLWVFRIGIPTGIENSMFQLGKLVVQSTVSTLGTAAIASNAIVIMLELISSTPSMGISTGVMTVAGQCIGAGKLDEAKKYIKKLTLWSAIVLFAVTWLIMGCTPFVAHLAKLEGNSYVMTLQVMLVISIVKPFLWPLAFVPANGMRAAGDGNFSMITATLTMWICRVGLTTVLCRFLGFGLIGIWAGYFADWFARSIINTLRFQSGKWVFHKVMQEE